MSEMIPLGTWVDQSVHYLLDHDAKTFDAIGQAGTPEERLPAIDDLEAVFLGGDRVAVTEVLSDPRLAPVRDKAGRVVLPVAEPRLARIAS